MSASRSGSAPIRVNILHGAANNGRIIVALIFREAALRFGTTPFSYVWTLVEPSAFIGIYLFFRLVVKDANPMFGDSSILFLLTGIIACRAIRATIAKGMKGIVTNLPLFEFGAIRPMDAVIARTTLEFTIWLLILTTFLVVVRIITGEAVVVNFQRLVIAMLMIYFYCIAMSMFNATVGALWALWRSLWRLLALPLYLASGIFFVPVQLPPDILKFVWWNPFLHCVEAIRENSYLDYTSVYSPAYLGSFSVTFMLIALVVEHVYRKEILRSRYDDDEDEL